MDVGTVLLMLMGLLLVLLVVLVLLWALMPPRTTEKHSIRHESELDQIKHQVELEGEQEAMEELMPYKPPRLNAPRQRKRL